MGTTIIGSFIGNWIGIVAVILCIPLIMAIALKFGSWEIFLLAFWGIVICGTLVGNEKPIKGWISGWIGLLIASVGIEPIHGVHRFTFDIPALIDGIGELPIIIGLFGLTEVMKSLSSPSVKIEVKKVTQHHPPVFDVEKTIRNDHPVRIHRPDHRSIAGRRSQHRFVSCLTYIAKQRAKGEEREKFGKGSYTGLMAAEVADNACIGGDLLPTLTLGIPGSAAMAIILGSLNLHGIRVGPALETHHPGLIYFFYGALIVANFLMYGVALVIIKPGVKLFTMKKEILMPIILPLCAIGAFGINQSTFDLYVMLATGLIGWALYKMRYPLAPYDPRGDPWSHGGRKLEKGHHDFPGAGGDAAHRSIETDRDGDAGGHCLYIL